MDRHRTLDEEIAANIRASEESGELRSSKDWGKPFDFGDGYDETPAELRMPFKILKDAGFVPPEVQMLKDVADLRFRLSSLDPYSAEADLLRRELAELQLRVSLLMERLQSS